MERNKRKKDRISWKDGDFSRVKDYSCINIVYACVRTVSNAMQDMPKTIAHSKIEERPSINTPENKRKQSAYGP